MYYILYIYYILCVCVRILHDICLPLTLENMPPYLLCRHRLAPLNVDRRSYPVISESFRSQHGRIPQSDTGMASGTFKHVSLETILE